VAYSQSGRHALTSSSVQKKNLNLSLSNIGEGFNNWGYIVVERNQTLDNRTRTPNVRSMLRWQRQKWEEQ